MLCELAADQGTAGAAAAGRQAGHNRLDDIGFETSRSDLVVEHQGLRAERDDVVDAHSHHIDSDGVPAVQRRGDERLGAGTVVRTHQHRFGEAVRQRRDRAEGPDVAQHFWPECAAGMRSQSADRFLPGCDAHPCCLVRQRPRVAGRGDAGRRGDRIVCHLATDPAAAAGCTLPVAMSDRLGSLAPPPNTSARVAAPISTGYYARQACMAETAARYAGCFDELVEAQVGQRIDPQELLDLFQIAVRCQQLIGRAGVHAVEARPAVRGRGDAQVHLGGASPAQQVHYGSSGGAPHNRIVDHHEPAPVDVGADRIQLRSYTQRPDERVRSDERATDVAVLDQSVAVGNSAGACIALCCGNARFGYRHDQVSLDRHIGRQVSPHALACSVDVLTGQGGVGSREIHELEDAQARGRAFASSSAAWEGPQ